MTNKKTCGISSTDETKGRNDSGGPSSLDLRIG